MDDIRRQHASLRYNLMNSATSGLSPVSESPTSNPEEQVPVSHYCLDFRCKLKVNAISANADSWLPFGNVLSGTSSNAPVVKRNADSPGDVSRQASPRPSPVCWSGKPNLSSTLNPVLNSTLPIGTADVNNTKIDVGRCSFPTSSTEVCERKRKTSTIVEID